MTPRAPLETYAVRAPEPVYVFRRVTRTCDWCRKVFSTFARNQKYCCRECKMAARKGVKDA